MSNEIKYWVARDKDGELWFYLEHPTRFHKGIRFKDESWVCIRPLGKSWVLSKDHPAGEGLTWEDKPRPVYLTKHSPEQIKKLVEAGIDVQLIIKDNYECHETDCKCPYRKLEQALELFTGE